MTKITIINFYSRMNKGSTALVNSTMSTLNVFLPKSEFTIISFRADYNQFTIKLLKSGGISLSNPILTARMVLDLIRCGFWYATNKYLGKDYHFLINSEILKNYFGADIIINTGGDGITEDYGSPLTYFTTFMMAILLNKPIVIYAESIGPFKKCWNKVISNFILNRISLITIREKISKKYLEDIGVTKPPIFVTADSAFLLEPSNKEDIEKILAKEHICKTNKPLIGISVSGIISNYKLNYNDKKRNYEDYIRIMARTIDYLAKNLGATIVFIPHVIVNGADDRNVASDILGLLAEKKNVTSINNEYTPEELKGIIGQCDLFIGARMHACIASTSMFVPTIAIAYSHKTHGIIGEMLNCKNYVIDVRELTYDLLISKVDNAWKNREKIKRELKTNVSVVREQSRLNGKLVKQLLDNLKSDKI